MLNGWMATKSYFWFAMSSIATLCLASESSPSNQVTSRLNSLAPVFGRLFALGTPAHLQTYIREGGFQRFLRPTGHLAYFGSERRREIA
jgi:hypothetical protein